MATLDGTITPPPPQWDPYATPNTTPPALLQQDPSLQFGSPTFAGGTPITLATATKFLQEVRVDYLWMPGKASKEFGMHDVDLSSTFAIPLFYNTQTPLLVTPGFAAHFWSGPRDQDVPPHVFDAYLQGAWNPQVTPWLGGELAFRVGVYSDFQKVTSDSLRYTATGLMVLSFSPSIKIKGGIWYLDRNRIQILPAGGIIWTPNADTRCEILFPNPKLARRLSTIGTTEWWGYARGNYGGGAWTYQDTAGAQTSIDYNDLRVAVGAEFDRAGGLNGYIEVGAAFERELFNLPGNPGTFPLTTIVFVGAGLAY